MALKSAKKKTSKSGKKLSSKTKKAVAKAKKTNKKKAAKKKNAKKNSTKKNTSIKVNGVKIGTSTTGKVGKSFIVRDTHVPVTINGVEFDALIDGDKAYKSTVPNYTTESGYPVSDTIQISPPELSMTLYISDTPVTWAGRSGHGKGSVLRKMSQLKDIWYKKQLCNIVTPDAAYGDMGMTSLSIKKSKELGTSREVSVSFQRVWTTAKQTTRKTSTKKGGKSKASGGKAGSKSKGKSSKAAGKVTGKLKAAGIGSSVGSKASKALNSLKSGKK